MLGNLKACVVQLNVGLASPFLFFQPFFPSPNIHHFARDTTPLHTLSRNAYHFARNTIPFYTFARNNYHSNLRIHDTLRDTIAMASLLLCDVDVGGREEFMFQFLRKEVKRDIFSIIP